MDQNTILIRLSNLDAQKSNRNQTLQDDISAIFHKSVGDILAEKDHSIEMILEHFYLENDVVGEAYELIEMPFGLLMRPK